jgi:hypothetical protein
LGSLLGSSSEAEAREGGEVEDEGFEESLPLLDDGEVALAEPEFVEVEEVDDPEGEDDGVEGEEEVVDGEDPVEFGEAEGELLAVVEFVPPEFGLPELEPADEFESSLSAAPSLRRCSVGRSLLLSSSITGGANFLVLVCALMPSGNQLPSAIQL